MLKLSREFLLTIALIIIIIALIFLNIENSFIFVDEPNNVQFDGNTINLSSLTLKQKIAQMLIVYEKEENKEVLRKMLIGGVYFEVRPSKSDFTNSINNFQEDAIIPFFTAVDLEGCLNPFEMIQEFPASNEIATKEEAYNTGYEQGKLLKEMGFNINFAPVVDLNDSIWNCRSFTGTKEEIAEKADYYIAGLQENGVIATSKHYPGKTLLARDPHKFRVYAVITEDDLFPFRQNFKRNVSAVMVSHLIVNGSVDSEEKPSDVSEKLESGLRKNFDGLIITDEIGMRGLRDFYSDSDKMYIDAFKSENDIILNFNFNHKNIIHMISVVEEAVNRGEISEERIDRSVTKILNAKGIMVVN